MSQKQDEEHEERISIPLDPEEALRALLKVDPDVEPEPPERELEGRDEKSDAA